MDGRGWGEGGRVERDKRTHVHTKVPEGICTQCDKVSKAVVRRRVTVSGKPYEIRWASWMLAMTDG